MIRNQRECAHEGVAAACCLIMNAIRTAPKARGIDLIETATVDGDDLRELSQQMLDLHKLTGKPVFLRDGNNILQGEAVILVGTPRHPMGLNCGRCGYRDCEDLPADNPCAFNEIDLGIAIGSAVSMAADLRLDTRVMYSAGMGALALNLLPGCQTVIAIAVGCSAKNPFFDR